MPIGRTPPLDSVDAKIIMVLDTSLGDPLGFPVGSAVALVSVDDALVYMLCGAVDPDQYPMSFLGFTKNVSTDAGTTLVTVGRGSIVTPVVENGDSLTPGQFCYLSMTAGEITQTPPNSAGTRLIKVGFAISPTQMVLVPDLQTVMV